MLIVPAGMVEDRMTSVWLLAISLSGLGVASPNTWTISVLISVISWIVFGETRNMTLHYDLLFLLSLKSVARRAFGP